MKIGITTFQYAHNYGAILQLAALQRILKEMGHEAEAINYLPPEAQDLPFWRGWGLRKGNLVANIKRRLIRFQHATETKRKFELFRTEFVNISEPCYSKEDVSELAAKYDAVITGSDQVWHFSNSSVYFLEWGNNYKGRRISYAPSCGVLDQPKDRIKSVQKWIKNIDYLSVRDEISRKVIEKVDGRVPEVVADPTLLVELNDMESQIQTPDDYIFMYVLGNEIKGGHQDMILEIRKHFGELPVVALVASAHKPQPFGWCDHTIWDAGPAEWLYLVRNATFVYTDSFHCSLFAIKNHKPFLSYYAEERRSPRLKDISKRYCLEKSITGNLEEALKNRFWEKNYNEIVEKKLKNHINDSLLYLTNTLN